MSGHGAVSSENKRVAMLIAVLALLLAIGETMAKGAQTSALSENIEASNLWAFFQARTIRATVLRTASESADLQRAGVPESAGAEAFKKRQDEWAKTTARWESEPETGEGRKELAARAKAAEGRRDTALARYHHYEIGSAAFQVGIVLASAMVITGIAALAYLGAALGLVGMGMLVVGLFAPHAFHLL